MTRFSRELMQQSGYALAGFADRYDAFRPAPPEALLDLLVDVAGGTRPKLVVDLGSGTGLSTRAWARRAADVVGVEPQESMREAAEGRTAEPNVRYVAGFADATGLPDGCADLVTCSQSFHWMEPEPTLAEVARILRPGGVFGAYDYDVPPFVHAEVDEAFFRALEDRRGRRRQRGIAMGAERWPKEEHLARIQASGRFRFARELVLHGREEGGVDRVVGLLSSLGPDLEGDEAAREELREVAERVLADRVVPWHVGYRVRLALK